MIRFYDLVLSAFALFILIPILLTLVVVGYLDSGSPIFRQIRVGRGMKPFYLLKFRSMKANTPSVATHLVDPLSITPFGSFLRKSKLDELPQLWNVFVGDMSLVGPRPNLFNQEALIKERISQDVYSWRPGITGLAQIHKIDMSTPQLLAETDYNMIQELNTFNYFKILFLTIFGKGFGDRVKDHKDLLN